MLRWKKGLIIALGLLLIATLAFLIYRALRKPSGGGNDPEIIDKTDQLPKHPTKRFNQRDASKIDKLIVHHTACAGSAGCDVEATARYHVQSRDWPGIGYHFFVQKDGKIIQTNHLDTLSSHTAGQNTTGVGVVLQGDFTQEMLQPTQRDALVSLLRYLRKKLGKPSLAIAQHRDFKATGCPGINIEEIKKLV